MSVIGPRVIRSAEGSGRREPVVGVAGVHHVRFANVGSGLGHRVVALFSADGFDLIAELKRRSPAMGVLRDASDDWLEFRVSDRGPGILPEHAEAVFTPVISTRLLPLTTSRPEVTVIPFATGLVWTLILVPSGRTKVESRLKSHLPPSLSLLPAPALTRTPPPPERARR